MQPAVPLAWLSFSHFLFLLLQMLDGLPQDRFAPALLTLSSVTDHNVQYMVSMHELRPPFDL